jgi:Tfp pilus assembly protein PilX
MRMTTAHPAPARRLRADDGFSMFLTIMTMFVTAMFVAAGFAAANGDLPLSGDSRDRKLAFAGAEAGLSFYQYHLNQDNDYWLKCTNVAPPNTTEKSPVNQVWDGTSDRNWRTVPGSSAQYTIELLPAPGHTQCVEQQQVSMINPANGSFRIRVTGRPREGSTLKRSIVATFRRKSFLDFLYFTDFETTDPKNYASTEAATASACAGKYRPARNLVTTGSGCREISFVTGDGISGPVHTNDNVQVCGTPYFGRTSPDMGDVMEITGNNPSRGWVDGPSGSCSGNNPSFAHPPVVGAKPVPMPSTNSSIKDLAQTDYSYVGPTTISITGDQMWVTNAAKGWTNMQKDTPPNGVIYVANDPTKLCSPEPPSNMTYNASKVPGCGDLTVSGTSSESLTLAAANDIIVRADPSVDNSGLLKTGDAVIGLIADNFVRLYHQSDNSGVPTNVEIDAAILSLAHSFTVDNYGKGSPNGKLTVNGAIAQKYRGAVGTGGASSLSSGFKKNYVYDDRLKFQTPPYFLQPVAASWSIVKRHEQVPAR